MNIPYPTVPIAPGVPGLTRDGSNTFTDDDIVIAAQDSPDISPQQITTMTNNPWAILDRTGKRVITPDTFLRVESRGDADIATYPIEQGAFSSYNKVAQPNDVRVILGCSGRGEMDRAQFLDRIKSMKSSLDLYTITTPEDVYDNMNMYHYDMKREASSGVTLLSVECWFQEIRNTAVATTTQSADPSGEDPVALGLMSYQPYSLTGSQDLKSFGVT